ncbi:trypsin-like peptidase domain-containing protein [Eubacteriales bacterium OttesenSCG-928-N13]|nr:trypsin-like peptidase domain-containing protein [Eubacteriales bacterium OttesenSCG-928-N13]
MKMKKTTGIAMLLVLAMTTMLFMGALAAGTDDAIIVDTNPAIAVAKNTQTSVVGVITNDQTWDRGTGETTEEAIGQGSGVVIKEGGYILTNNHVVKSGSSYQVLLPSGEKISAKLIGTDSSTDLAVLQVEDATGLTPVKIGSAKELPVGSTVIAIGNPGGELLANTVTSGVISALERSVDGNNTTRDVTYIQHDAAISSGNSGGGLFDVNSQLIGINTLKYGGNAYSFYSTSTYEGLGFAIPIDLAMPIVEDLIQYQKVRRPAMGVTVANYEGPEEPMNNYPPMSVCVYTVGEGSPAAEAGMQAYDFITHVDGVRVLNLRELARELDNHKEGDTVEITAIRYKNTQSLMAADTTQQSSDSSTDGSNGSYGYQDPFGGYFGNNPFGDYYGGYGGGNSNANTRMSLGGYDEVKMQVTLKILD